MTDTIAPLLSRWFGIEPEDARPSLYLFTILFLIITTLLLLKPVVNSIFISQLGTSALPMAYIVTAFFAVVGSYFDGRNQIIDFRKKIKDSLIAAIAVVLAFGLLLHFQLESPFLIYLLYAFVAIYGLLTSAQFWLAANSFFNVQHAKKAFGFIGAGGILGGIFGGYLTSFLTRFIQVEDILFVVAGILLLCLPLYHYLWSLKPNASSVENQKQQPDHKQSALEVIKSNKLLLSIVWMTALAVFASKLIDFQYNEFVATKFPNKEDMGSFFGSWLSNISIFSLLIQLFLTKLIIKKFGVGNSLFIMPAGLLFASVLLIFIPELWVVLALKVWDGSLKQSLNKSVRELIFMPIPTAQKQASKGFIDVVVDSLATGTAGLILFLILRSAHLPLIYISLITCAFILLWLISIVFVKRNYSDAYKHLALDGIMPSTDIHSAVLQSARNGALNTQDPIAMSTFIGQLDAAQPQHKYVKATIPQLLDGVESGIAPYNTDLQLPAIIAEKNPEKALTNLIKLYKVAEAPLALATVKQIQLLDSSKHKQKINKFVHDATADVCNSYTDYTLAITYIAELLGLSQKEINKTTYSDVDLSGLLDSIYHKRSSTIAQLPEILKLKYDPNTMQALEMVFDKEDHQRMDYAMEYVDTILDTELRKHISPVLASIAHEHDISQQVSALGKSIDNTGGSLEHICKLNDSETKTALMRFIQNHPKQHWSSVITLLKEDKNVKIRQLAEALSMG